MVKKSSQIYLEHIVANIPHYVFWKDLNSTYLGCNENFALAAGLKNPEEIIGKTDRELPWAKDANNYLKEDLEIINTGKCLQEKELPFVTAAGNHSIIMVSKTPLRDESNKIIGVLGIYTDITERKQMEKELLAAKECAEAALKAKEIAEFESREKSIVLKNILEELKEKRYYLTGKYSGVYLTNREAQCVICLPRGNTAKEIGKILNLSPRTVETNLNNIKRKLNCKTRSELINKATECRFLEGIMPVV